MSRHAVPVAAVLAMLANPACALSLSDPLTAWRDSTAMEHIRIATQLGRSFVALNAGFTADFFVTCIDDVSTYGNSKTARIEDAVRECVASKIGKPDNDE